MTSVMEVVEFLRAAQSLLRGSRDEDAQLRGARSLDLAGPGNVAFCTNKVENALERIASSRAELIIVDRSITESLGHWNDGATLISSADPRLDFVRVVQRFFTPPLPRGIHPTAFIESSAQVGRDVYIGPFSYVGKSSIGDGTVIYGHAHIYDGVKIGARVIIHGGAILGADGFGFQANSAGTWEKFPHIGGVVVEDEVEIGANTCVDRGTLGDTIIRRGAKLDNLVHIAHNVEIGRDAIVTANAMVAGSTVIGDRAWIAPSATLLDKIRVGNDALVGLGAVVTKNVGDNEIVYPGSGRIGKRAPGPGKEISGGGESGRG